MTGVNRKGYLLKLHSNGFVERRTAPDGKQLEAPVLRIAKPRCHHGKLSSCTVRQTGAISVSIVYCSSLGIVKSTARSVVHICRASSRQNSISPTADLIPTGSPVASAMRSTKSNMLPAH